MILSEVSIRRPVFATVLSLLLVILGAAALLAACPCASIPDIDPAGGLDRDAIPRGVRRGGGDQDHPGDRGPHRGARGDREAHVLQLGATSDRISASSSGWGGISTSAANDVRDRVARALVDALPDEADPPEIAKVDNDTRRGDVPEPHLRSA